LDFLLGILKLAGFGCEFLVERLDVFLDLL